MRMNNQAEIICAQFYRCDCAKMSCRLIINPLCISNIEIVQFGILHLLHIYRAFLDNLLVSLARQPSILVYAIRMRIKLLFCHFENSFEQMIIPLLWFLVHTPARAIPSEQKFTSRINLMRVSALLFAYVKFDHSHIFKCIIWDTPTCAPCVRS